MTNWHYFENGRQKGPLPENELLAMIRDGRLPANTHAWAESGKEEKEQKVSKWFYKAGDGITHGPYDKDVINEWVQQGTIGPDAFVGGKDGTDWVTADQWLRSVQEEMRINTECANPSSSSSVHSNKQTHVGSFGKGVTQLLIGVGIIALNLIFLAPSAAYFAFWVAGVFKSIQGLIEIITSFSAEKGSVS